MIIEQQLLLPILRGFWYTPEIVAGGKPQEFAGIAKEKPVVPAPYALDWYHLTELCKAIHTARTLVH